MNANGPFFSIVIPAYNRADFLKQAIQSVINQTFTDFELIIVDDGSTDNTAEVVRKWEDKRIKYFFKQNEERSIARNFGISKSQGEYINFLDSDDYFYPHHLITAYNRLIADAFPKALHMGFEIRNNTGDLLFIKNNFTNRVNKQLIFGNILLGNSFFIKSEVFTEIRFLNSRDAMISEDWYLWLRLAARYTISIDNTITNVLVEHSKRSLNNMDAVKVEKSISIIIEELRKDNRVMEYYASRFSFFLARNWCFLALCFILNNNLVKTREYLRLSKKEYPFIVLTKNYIAVLRKYFILLIK